MNKFIMFFITSLMFFSCTVCAKQIDKIYVFGDSLSDTGNLYSLLKHQIPVTPPYFNGHFSNGLMWPEYLTDALGLPAKALDNYSFGGAKTKSSGRLPPPGLDSMLANYFSEHPRISNQTLHIIWMGANNYLRTSTPSGNEVMPTVNDLIQSVMKLVKKGSKNIIVMNIPDVGMIPYAQQKDASNNNKNYSSVLSEASKQHNKMLAERLDELTQELAVNYPDVTLVQIDIMGLLQELTMDPKKFNITNMTEPCYKGKYFLYDNKNICADRDEYLFWDGFHPTTAVHEAIAYHIRDVLNSKGYTIINPLYKQYAIPDNQSLQNFKLYGME